MPATVDPDLIAELHARGIDPDKAPAPQSAVPPSPFTAAATSLVGTDGGQLGCASTVCHVLTKAGIPFPMTPSAAGMEQAMPKHGFVRVPLSDAQVVFGKGTGPSGRHAAVHIGNGQTIEDPGGSRGNRVQYGRLTASDPTATGWAYKGQPAISVDPDLVAELHARGINPNKPLPAATAPAQSLATPSVDLTRDRLPDGSLDYKALSTDPGTPLTPAPLQQTSLPAAPSAASLAPLLPPPPTKANGASQDLLYAEEERRRGVIGAAIHAYNAKAKTHGVDDMDSAALLRQMNDHAAWMKANGYGGTMTQWQKANADWGKIDPAKGHLAKQGAAGPGLLAGMIGDAKQDAQGLLQSVGSMAGGVLGAVTDTSEEEDHDASLQQGRDAVASLGKGVVLHPLGLLPGEVTSNAIAAGKAGTLGQFTAGVPAGLAQNAQQHPLNMGLDVLNALALGTLAPEAAASQLGRMAEAADTAGNAGRAATLRAASQSVRRAAFTTHRAVTGGPVGDAVQNAIADAAEKIAPGSDFAKAQRFKASFRTGAAQHIQSQAAAAALSPAERAVAARARPSGGFPADHGTVQPLLPAGRLPAPLSRQLPAPELPLSAPPLVATLPKPTVRVVGTGANGKPLVRVVASTEGATPLVSAAGKPLHEEAPIGPNNTMRHSDGTFAPVSASPTMTSPGIMPTEEPTHGQPEATPASIAAAPLAGDIGGSRPDASGELGNGTATAGSEPGTSGDAESAPAAGTSATPVADGLAPITQTSLQAAFHPAGADGTPPAVLLNDKAYSWFYKSIAGQEAGPEHKAVTVTAPHLQFLKAKLDDAAPHLAPAQVTARQHVIDTLAHGLRQNDGRGIGVTRVHAETSPTIIRQAKSHEHTHVMQEKWRLPDTAQASLNAVVRAPHIAPLFNKAAAVLRGRGYTPPQIWRELPAWIVGGHYDKLGLTRPQAESLLTPYAQQLHKAYGGQAVQETLGHGGDAARSVAAQFPPDAMYDLSPSPHRGGSHLYAPDEMRLLTTDELVDVRKAGLLSSPKQVVKAVAGHIAAMASDEVARIPATLIDFLISAATGKDRTIGNLRLSNITQAAQVGATKGIKLGFQVMLHGSHGMNNPLLPANHPEFHTGMRLVDAYVNGVFRMHEGAYAGLRMFALHRALLELADVGAMAAVRHGSIPKAQQEAFRKSLYASPSPAMQAAAISAAEEATLTNANRFSRMYQKAYEEGGPVGRAVMSQVIPFPKIESNVAGRSLEMATGTVTAPLVFARQVMTQHGFTADQQRRFGMTFGRGMTGLGLIALGAMIYAKKRGQESDEKHHVPVQVEYGGRLYPTNTVAPISNLVQVGIDASAERDKAREGQSASVGNALANLLMEQPYLKANPGDLLEMLSSGRDAKRQIGQQAGSFVPAILADVAAQGDKYKRKQTEPFDFVKNRLPGLRETLPVATDALGQPKREAPNRLFNPFGGTLLSPADTAAMRRIGAAKQAQMSGERTPAQEAAKALRQSLFAQAGQGKNIRPALRQDIANHLLTPGLARHILRESRLTPTARRFEGLPLPEALEAYRLGNASEREQWRPLLHKKIRSAAQRHTLAPADLQKAEGLLR